MVLSDPYRLLPHKTSKGYEPSPFSVVKRINGVKVRNLAHVVEIIRDAKEGFLTIELAGEREEIAKVTDDILSDEVISRPVAKPRIGPTEPQQRHTLQRTSSPHAATMATQPITGKIPPQIESSPRHSNRIEPIGVASHANDCFRMNRTTNHAAIANMTTATNSINRRTSVLENARAVMCDSPRGMVKR
jgi:hypothetical protein